MSKCYIVSENPIDSWGVADLAKPESVHRCWCGRDISIHGITIHPKENDLVSFENEEDKSIGVFTSDQPASPRKLGYPGQIEYSCRIESPKYLWPNHNSNEVIVIRPETYLDRIKSFFFRRIQR